MTKEDKQIIERATKENWQIGDRTRLKHLLEKNLKLYRENVELEKACDETQELLDKQIEATYKLDKENEELKAKNKWYSEQVCNKECAEVWGNLTKAIAIIKSLLSCCRNYPQENAEKMEQAEQFLNDIKE